MMFERYIMIDAELIRIKQEVLKSLLQEHEYMDLETYRDKGEASVWIGTYWQVIHYILTGEVAWRGRSFLPPPCCNIILGGKPLYPEEDAICYLTYTELKAVKEFLKERPVSWVEQEFHKIKYRPVIIYHTDMRDDDELPEILFVYERLYSIYMEAKEGDAMILRVE
jgi:hypothetical protein